LKIWRSGFSSSTGPGRAVVGKTFGDPDESDRLSHPIAVHFGDVQVFSGTQPGQPAVELVLNIRSLAVLPGQVVNEIGINGRRAPGKGVVAFIKDGPRVHRQERSPPSHPLAADKEKE